MKINNTQQEYGCVSKSFHWLMSLIIIGLLSVGLYMVDLPSSEFKGNLYGWHKKFGILILMLAALRIIWRSTQINPKLPATLPHWQKRAANSVYVAFYGFMVLMPLSGWLMSNAYGRSVSFFDLFMMPTLIAPNEYWGGIFKESHELFSNALMLVLVVHIVGALFHHFYLKDNILRRMLP